MAKKKVLAGKKGQPLRQPYHYVECGLDNVWLVNGFLIEHDEELGELFSIEGMDELHRVIGMHIVCSDPKIDGKEMRFLRKQMGITQKELADIVGTSRLTIQRYESGQTQDNGPLDRMVRVLYASHVKGILQDVLEKIKQLSFIEDEASEDYTLNVIHENGRWRPTARVA